MHLMIPYWKHNVTQTLILVGIFWSRLSFNILILSLISSGIIETTLLYSAAHIFEHG